MPIISIVGTKGGTGKSTVSMGIAIWLAKIQPTQMRNLEHGQAEQQDRYRGNCTACPDCAER